MRDTAEKNVEYTTTAAILKIGGQRSLEDIERS